MYLTDMSLPRFFLSNQILSDEAEEVFALRLDTDDLNHIKALRLTKGEHLVVIDATSDYFECEITDIDSRSVFVRISQRKNNDSLRPTVVLAQGICKGEKMDKVICHATELGVAGFIPLICDRSVVKLTDKKVDARIKRWNSIAKSAAMQSGQSAIPEISEPMTIFQLQQFAYNASCLLVFWEEEHQQTLHEALWNALSSQGIAVEDARILVVIGPEGGLDETEVSLLCGDNPFATTVGIGPSILRTETAGVVAPALVLYELGALS